MNDRRRATADGSAPADLPAWTLVQAAHLVGRRFHEVFASQGLSAHQFGVLVQLSRQPAMSQASLARGILVTPQSVGEILVQMEETGLVVRKAPRRPGGPIEVELTLRGRGKLGDTFPLVAELNRPESLGLDPAESEQLNELLHRVHDHLDDRPFKPLAGGV